MPDRIRLARAKGWRMPEGVVNVSRASIWGNPWRVGTPGSVLLPLQVRVGWGMDVQTAGPLTPTEAVGAYRAWLDGQAAQLPARLNARGRHVYRDRLELRRAAILSRLPELRGHTLACWCALDAPCHADVLLEMANA